MPVITTNYSVLNNSEMAEHALFYFRDPAYVEEVAEDRRKNFSTEDSASRQKLTRLKEDVRQQYREGKLKYAPRENYPEPQTLGQLVLVDLTEVIDGLFPAVYPLD